MLGCAVIAIGIALLNIDSVFALMNYAWSGVASAFAPLMLLFFTRPKLVTKEGALAGMAVGLVVPTVWYVLNWSAWLHEIAPGMVIATITILIVSKCTRAKYEKALAETKTPAETQPHALNN